MDLLRRMGALEKLEGRPAQDRRRIAEKPDSNSAESSQRVCVAVRQRWAAAGRRRENVSRHPEGFELAESVGVVRVGITDDRYRRVRREDDRALRKIGRASCRERV